MTEEQIEYRANNKERINNMEKLRDNNGVVIKTLDAYNIQDKKSVIEFINMRIMKLINKLEFLLKHKFEDSEWEYKFYNCIHDTHQLNKAIDKYKRHNHWSDVLTYEIAMEDWKENK